MIPVIAVACGARAHVRERALDLGRVSQSDAEGATEMENIFSDMTGIDLDEGSAVAHFSAGVQRHHGVLSHHGALAHPDVQYHIT